MTAPRFTCLVPAYDEAARIGPVLDAVIGHPLVEAVVVIDDGSTDDTAEVARRRGAIVLRTPGNLGKTRALAAGLAATTTSHVLLIDADLVGLTPEAITALVEPVRARALDATISLRGNAPRLWRLIGVDYISGERALPLALLAGEEATLARLPRFGFEVFVNRLFLASGARVGIVRWPAVKSPPKAAKRGLLPGLIADAAMIRDVIRTVGAIECLRQIVALSPAARRGGRRCADDGRRAPG